MAWMAQPSWSRNPPRIPLMCFICGETFMKPKHELRPGQRTTCCSTLCVTIKRMLWSPFQYPGQDGENFLKCEGQ